MSKHVNNSPTNLLVWRVNTIISVLAHTDVTFELRQYTSAYHQRGDMDHNEERGESREDDQKNFRYAVILVILYLKQ